jgi:aldehyde dehydrogenase (NAD+)
LGGKSAAVILDDADLEAAAATIASAEWFLSGQVCSSLTRLVVSRSRQDEFVEALAAVFSQKRVGDAFDANTQMGPLAMARQRDRVEGYIAKGVAEGATLVTGGGRPKDLDRGYFIEPTVFSNVENTLTIAQEEIFGRHPGRQRGRRGSSGERHHLRAERVGLHERCQSGSSGRRPIALGHRRSQRDAHRLRGFLRWLQAVGHRARGREGILPYLETKTVILNDIPAPYTS